MMVATGGLGELFSINVQIFIAAHRVITAPPLPTYFVFGIAPVTPLLSLLMHI